MNRRTLFVVAAVFAILGLSPTVLAQGYGEGMGTGSAPGPDRMGARRFLPDPAGLPALKSTLRITAAQETHWQAYAGAVTATWERRQAMQQGLASMPPGQRFEGRADRQAAGAEIHADLDKARADLVSVLTPEQRLRLDQAAPLPPSGQSGPPR